MEAALVSVATGALKPVLGKLGALLGDKYKRFKGMRKEINSLTNELAAMDAFLMKMSEEEDPDVQDTVWMNEVRELSYNMEDCIDDFMLSVGDKDTKPEGFVEKMKHSLGELGKMKARRRIGNEIRDLKKQIAEVADRNQRYKTGAAISSTKNSAVDPRALAIFEHASKLVGIDEPKAEIVKLLSQEDGHTLAHQHPKLVSIVGSGGMGKTTLANEVYQHLKAKFDCSAFLSVSRNPDMMNILQTILTEVRRDNTKADNIQQLISYIRNFLADKRYFVVVDDIWEVDTWDVIKLIFPMTSFPSFGSIIITTTRINDVAKTCRSSFNGDIYRIRPLYVVHSRQLFHRRLFDSNENCPLHLEEVSEQILQKCDGLPLAIITMAGLLAGRGRTEDLWNQVKDSIGCALERNHGVKRMMKILSLSYFDLPPHLRSCLLYMVIFPEDFIIEKKHLIMRWIGEGFIHKEGIYTIYEIGERCFNELLNRGLIQPMKTDKYGTLKTCRVHDMIRDFIISKSAEENFVTLVGVPILTSNKVVRRLSLQVSRQGHSTIQTSSMVLSHVRSLNVFGKKVEIPSLEQFRHLRVLFLKNCAQLRNCHLENIVQLFQLRYLNLYNTKTSKLPEQIGRLGCLEMLDIRCTCIRELPASIVNLGKLTHLHIDIWVKFPDGIAKMQALETLRKVRTSEQPLDFCWGLGQLKNLRNVYLEFQGNMEDTDVVWEEYNKAILPSLCKLGTQNLRSLTIVGGSSFLHKPLGMVTLEKLITWGSPISQIPKWMSSLRNLRHLRLALEEVKQDDLTILGALPTLLILDLFGVTQSKDRLRISGETGFQFLRIFRYNAHSHPVDLMFAAGSMPKLEKLQFYSLILEEAESLDFRIENLPCLTTIACTIAYGEVGIVEAAKAVMEKAANTHRNHPSIVLDTLESWNYKGLYAL